MNNEEPTVLDYVKSCLTPWKGKPIPIPPAKSETLPLPAEGLTQPEGAAPSDAIHPLVELPASEIAVPSLEIPAPAIATPAEAKPAATRIRWAWPALLAVFVGIFAQFIMRPRPERTWIVGLWGLGIYLLAAAWMILSNALGEWRAAPIPADETRDEPDQVRVLWMIASVPFTVAAFYFFKANQFNTLNLILWGAAIFCLVFGLWLPRPAATPWLIRLINFIRQPRWSISFSRSALLALAIIGVVVFFRVYRINEVPPEMVSDQAEKLLDVWDVLHGQTQIFFPRNTGREALQMYMTAAIVKYLGTGYSFLSLKIGTVLAGLLTLPFIYLLGKEVANKRVGWLALLFAGIGYWPNVISRVGLRFPLYPLFVAPVLYYLIRGLRTRNRNDFILCGIALGIGLHGYTPIRILPFVVVAAVGLYLIHKQASGARRQAIFWLAIVAIVSAYVFLPLLRYAQENPEGFSFRAFSRVGSVEQPLPDAAWKIFLENTGRAMAMFAWDDGEIWVHSVTHRPALDTISAVLFYLGMALLLWRYIWNLITSENGKNAAHWLDLFLPLSVPLLMMPSILSLAFPAENPALNRAGGAYVTVFIIVAIALDGLLTALETHAKTAGRRVGWVLAIVLLFWSAAENYGLVFRQYYQSYVGGAWNTSEMGDVVREFAVLSGTSDTAWVVAYPYWVDTRLVGMNAGLTTRDMAIWPDHFADTLNDPRMKLFIIYPEDQQDQETLRQLYPQGQMTTYVSHVGKDFLLYLVPPSIPPTPLELLAPAFTTSEPPE